MIKKVELYICDDCDNISFGSDGVDCINCGEPMKLVTFVRALDPICRICGKPKSEHIRHGHKYQERVGSR